MGIRWRVISNHHQAGEIGSLSRRQLVNHRRIGMDTTQVQVTQRGSEAHILKAAHRHVVSDLVLYSSSEEARSRRAMARPPMRASDFRS